MAGGHEIYATVDCTHGIPRVLEWMINKHNLTKNYGQQIAIYAALREVNSDYYGAIDSDGQQDPSLFLKMIRVFIML